MKLQKVLGATSEIWQVFIQDSSSTTGAGLPGLAFNTASLTAYYHRDTDTTATSIALATMTTGTFTSSGFKEIDATNMPGCYQLCPPNAALASGAKSVLVALKGAANMAPLVIEVQLTAVNPDSATTFMTSVATVTTVTNQLTAAQIATGVWQDTTSSDFTVASSIGKSLFTSGAVPGAAGGLFIAGTNAATAVTTSFTTTFTGNLTGNVGGSVASVTARVTANTDQWAGGTIPAPNVTGVPLTDSKYLLGTIVATPATAGILDVNIKNIKNATSAGAAGYVGLDWATINAPSSTQNLSGTTIAGSGGPTAAAVATAVWQDTTAGDFTVSGSIGKSLFTSGNAPGAASGLALVGSNMGTVSSVTGNVGGSVASVTARVTANADQLAGQTVTAAAGVTFPTSVASPTNITAGTITTATNLTNAPTSGDFTGTMKTSLGTAVAAQLATTTYAELSAVPAATATIADKITWMFMLARNKITQTGTAQTLRSDGDAGSVASAAESDNGTTFVRGQYV